MAYFSINPFISRWYPDTVQQILITFDNSLSLFRIRIDYFQRIIILFQILSDCFKCIRYSGFKSLIRYWFSNWSIIPQIPLFYVRHTPFPFQEVIIKTFPVGFSYQFAIKFQISGQYGYYLPGSNVLSQHFQYFNPFLNPYQYHQKESQYIFIQQLQRFSDIDVESLFQIIKSLGFIHTLYRNEFFIIPSVIYIIFTYAINKGNAFSKSL